MNYNCDELLGKQRKKGGEAPSARVYKSESEDMIIGMMAVNTQLLLSLYSLEDEDCVKIIQQFEEVFKDEKRLNPIVVVKDDFETIEQFKKDNNIERFLITRDSKGDFSKRFGVGLDDSKYPNKMASALFIIDKEAELKFVNYFNCVEKFELMKSIEIINEVINFKQKGHTHENWMGV